MSYQFDHHPLRKEPQKHPVLDSKKLLTTPGEKHYQKYFFPTIVRSIFPICLP